jgi:RNA polymerase sigma factor (TIGR02999 family)
MSNTSPHDVTQLLREISGGDADAPAKLMPVVYDELRRQARAYLQRDRPDHTLQPTALVHEAYLRLVQEKEVRWKDRAHFFGIAARLMRQILVNYAKAHNSAKRGGGVPKLSLDEAEIPAREQPAELIALDDALKIFEEDYPRQSRVVELKFFGGMETKEIAEVLQVSEKTVTRDWDFGKLWLFRELRAKDMKNAN